MARNPMRSFFQSNPAPQPRPMAPTMGSAIRGMFGGPKGGQRGTPMSGPGWGPVPIQPVRPKVSPAFGTPNPILRKGAY